MFMKFDGGFEQDRPYRESFKEIPLPHNVQFDANRDPGNDA